MGLRSISHCKALSDMRWLFQLVYHRDGIVLNRDRTVARGVYQELICSQTELSSTRPWFQLRGWLKYDQSSSGSFRS